MGIICGVLVGGDLYCGCGRIFILYGRFVGLSSIRLLVFFCSKWNLLYSQAVTGTNLLVVWA